MLLQQKFKELSEVTWYVYTFFVSVPRFVHYTSPQYKEVIDLGETGKEEFQSSQRSSQASRGGERIQREAADDKCNEVHAASGPCSIPDPVTSHQSVGKPSSG